MNLKFQFSSSGFQVHNDDRNLEAETLNLKLET